MGILLCTFLLLFFGVIPRELLAWGGQTLGIWYTIASLAWQSCSLHEKLFAIFHEGWGSTGQQTEFLGLQSRPFEDTLKVLEEH